MTAIMSTFCIKYAIFYASLVIILLYQYTYNISIYWSFDQLQYLSLSIQSFNVNVYDVNKFVHSKNILEAHSEEQTLQ